MDNLEWRMRENAAQAVMTGRNFGRVLDLSVDSLNDIDSILKIFTNTYGASPLKKLMSLLFYRKKINELSSSFGSYIGEVFVRNLGCSWEIVRGSLTLVTHKGTLCPQTLVKSIIKGRSDISLYKIYTDHLVKINDKAKTTYV